MAKEKFEVVTISEEKKAELEAEHEDILILRGSERSPWLVAMRRPNRQQTLQYKGLLKQQQVTANESLVRQIRIYPEVDSFEKQMDRWPLLCDGIADNPAFQEFIGVATSEHLK